MTDINLHFFHFLVAFCVVQVPLVVYLSNSFFHSVDLEAWFQLTHSQVCPVFHHWVSVDLPVPYIQFQCLLHTSHSNLWFLHGKHYTSVTLTFDFANDRSTCFMVGILCKKLLANFMTEPDKTLVGLPVVSVWMVFERVILFLSNMVHKRLVSPYITLLGTPCHLIHPCTTYHWHLAA